MALLLMALLELRGMGSHWLMAFGAALLLGRALHAQCLINNNATWGRLAGMVLTIGVISIEGVCALWIFLR